MSSVIFSNAQRIIAAIFDWLQTSSQGRIADFITDTFSAGIDNATTAGEGFLVVPGTNNTSLTPSVNVTLGGIAYDLLANRIYISPTDTTLYNPANITTTTNDGLGNLLATPQSTGVVNIPVTQGSQNYLWIDYLPTINTSAFTTNEITNAKIFYEQTDGYNIQVTTVNVPPDANSIFVASVNMTGGGAVAPSNISTVGRTYMSIDPKMVPITTPFNNGSNRTPSYIENTTYTLDAHIKSIGTGTGISSFNPHNMSLGDLGISAIDTVVGRSQIEGNNNVIITTNPNPVASAMASYINGVTYGSDTLNVYALSTYGGIPEYAIVNGAAYSGTQIFGVALTNATVPFPAVSGFYYVYWDSVAQAFGVSTSIAVTTDVTKLLLASVTYTYVGSTFPPDHNILSGLTDLRLIGGTNSLLQRWTTVARPVNPVVGEFGFNTTLGILEYWDGTAWQQVVEASANGNVPSGAMLDFAGTSASIPTGYLPCDGSVVSQATYANLFAVINTIWNTGGEGVGNFRLPNFQRSVAVGSGGTGTTELGSTVGSVGGVESETHTHTENPHTHNQANNGITNVNIGTNIGIYDISGNPPSPSSDMGATNTAGGNPCYRLTAGTTTQSNSGMSSFTSNNFQPSAVVTKIIKY